MDRLKAAAEKTPSISSLTTSLLPSELAKTTVVAQNEEEGVVEEAAK